MKPNFNECINALKKARKVEKEIAALWQQYEGREGAFAEMVRASVEMDYDDEAVILSVEMRWGYYNDNCQNNYQCNHTFYIEANRFNAMYLVGRMEQIVWED